MPGAPLGGYQGDWMERDVGLSPTLKKKPFNSQPEVSILITLKNIFFYSKFRFFVTFNFIHPQGLFHWEVSAPDLGRSFYNLNNS